MSGHDRRNDWSIIGAIALIVMGVWLLLGQVGGPWFGAISSAVHFIASLAWPLALIAGGVLLLVAGRKGGISGGSDGRRLYRSRTERMVGGVLGGLASYMGIDPTWVRIVFVILAILTGVGPAVVVYVFAMILVPEEPKAVPQAPVWPQAQATGTETVQVPPPAPPVPEPPVAAPPTPPAPEPPVDAAPATPAPPAPPLG